MNDSSWGLGRCAWLGVWLSAVAWLGVAVTGCGDDDVPAPDAGGDDAGEAICRESLDCDDGIFCNGVERCQPGSANADESGCVRGPMLVCDDGIACTQDICSHVQNRCLFVPPDVDGDSYPDATCLGPQDEPLGDDCDDNDPHRFPGNVEVCSDDAPLHDEDCNALTFGARDSDGDGAHADHCCNVDAVDVEHCGSDCDDTSPRVRDGYPELCDNVDNDCDGTEDDNTIEVPWYVDGDGDGYGDANSEAVMSCAIIPERSVVGTDCNDADAARHPAASELCNGIDDDCDDDTDEGDTCSCGAPGAIQPCVCEDNRNGFQSCQGDGAWAACDCRECVDQSVDCVAGLIPRMCMNGRWLSATACSGITPRCVEGECTCLDGTLECTTLSDRIAPFVQALLPGNNNDISNLPLDTLASAVLSETIDPASVTATTFRLLDSRDNPVPATRYTQGNTVTLQATGGLEPGRIYRAELAGIADLAGNVLSMPRSWRFMTTITQPKTLLATDALGPITLTAHPNRTALVTHIFSAPSVPGQAIYAFNGDTHTTLARNVGSPCMDPCITGGALWALAPSGGLAIASFGVVWSGPSITTWMDRNAVVTNVNDLRFANDNQLVWMNSSAFRLETRIGAAAANGNAGIQPQATLVTPPVFATNALGDILAVAVTDNTDTQNVRVVYADNGVLPSGNVIATSAQTANIELLYNAVALRENGHGVVAWVESRWYQITDYLEQQHQLSFATVSDTGVLGPATVARPWSNVTIGHLQAVASGDTVWITYLGGNVIQAISINSAGSAAAPIAVSEGVRVAGTIREAQASGESDGTLHVAWIESGFGLDVPMVASARRIAPDRALSRINTLVSGTTLEHLRSATYGTHEALTIVAETTHPRALYAIRN